MTNIVLLLVCLSAGVALPALVDSQLHGVSLSPQLALPVLMPWLLGITLSFATLPIWYVWLAHAV